MIHNDQELQTTWDRVNWFLSQVASLRKHEQNPDNYHASASGFLAEISKMQMEVREYLSVHPREFGESAK